MSIPSDLTHVGTVNEGTLFHDLGRRTGELADKVRCGTRRSLRSQALSLL